MLSHFDTAPACDGQTDRQTDILRQHDSSRYAGIARQKPSPNIAVVNMVGMCVTVDGCGNMPAYGGNVQQFNGPRMPDAGYPGGQFGYHPHAGGYPQPPDVRDASQYVMGPANQFPSVDGDNGQRFPNPGHVVPGNSVYPGSHPPSLQTATSQNNSSAPSFSSKHPAPVTFEQLEPGSQCKQKEEVRTFPSKSSRKSPTPDGKQMLPPISTESSSIVHSSTSSNGPVEQFSKRDSLSEVDQRSGEVTMGSSGNAGSLENGVRTSVPASCAAAYPPVAQQSSNTEVVRGRSSDVVAMEGMSSRYGVGPEGMIDGRYPSNGREGYMGRMGHPVVVDGTFRHSYQRQVEHYDRPLFGAQSGIPPHFQHPGYFNHPNHHGYQYHPYAHSSHGAFYQNPAGTVPAEVGHQMVPDRAGDGYGGMGRQQYPGLMTPPSSVTSCTSHPSNDCESDRTLPNGEVDAARRSEIQTKSSENSFAESTSRH